MMLSLTQVADDISTYGSLITLIIGSIGNLFNLMVFATRDFRTKTSILYLIYSTVSCQVFIGVGLIFRYFTEYNGSNLINTNLYICKSRGYLLLFLPLMSITYVFFSSFDRCVSTSSNNRWRRLSSISIARRICYTTTPVIIITSSFAFFAYGIYNGRCTTSPGLGSLITNLYISAFIFFIPITGMGICLILTWIHLKQSRNRIEAMSISGVRAFQNDRMNKQLITVTLVQTLVFMIAYSVRGFTFGYGIATALASKSAERQEIEYLVQQISLILLYFSNGVTFYLNYIFSKIFRKTFLAAGRHLTNKWFGACSHT